MKDKKKLVIIGGGFAGSLVAKKLENLFDVTLIDEKDFFEFTPGVLRAIVEPTHLKKIQVKHKDYLNNTKILKDSVQSVEKYHIILTHRKKIEYHYLVIASGSSYNPPIKSHNLVNASNTSLIRDVYKDLSGSKKILVVGGGIVGVELAAEVAQKFCDDVSTGKKIITLVHSQRRLIPRENKKACDYSEKILKKCGVNIIFDKRFTTEDVGKYDIIFLATGITPNTEFLSKHYLDEREFAKVSNTLQLDGEKNIFAAGDVTSIKEEKLAQTAEVHAKYIARNIIALENGEDLSHYKPSPKMKVISLGKYRGIITYKGLTVTGFIPGMVKGLFEWFYVKTL